MIYFEYELLASPRAPVSQRSGRFQDNVQGRHDDVGQQRLKRLSQSAKKHQRSASQNKLLKLFTIGGKNQEEEFENLIIKLDNVPITDPWLLPINIRYQKVYISEFKGKKQTQLKIEDIAKPSLSVEDILKKVMDGTMSELNHEDEKSECILPFIDNIVARQSSKQGKFELEVPGSFRFNSNKTPNSLQESITKLYSQTQTDQCTA